MIIRGKNIGRKTSDKKYEKALTAYQLDYIYNSKYSNIYVYMTREEEKAFQYDAIATYLNKWTIKQLDEHINNRRKELGFNYV